MSGKSLLLFNNCVGNYVAVMITNIECLFNKNDKLSTKCAYR